MTEELFDKACKLNKEINDCKKILKAFNSHYTNVIRCNDYEETKETTQLIMLSNEPELEMYIREYLFHKLDVLEQKFAKLT